MRYHHSVIVITKSKYAQYANEQQQQRLQQYGLSPRCKCNTTFIINTCVVMLCRIRHVLPAEKTSREARITDVSCNQLDKQSLISSACLPSDTVKIIGSFSDVNLYKFRGFKTKTTFGLQHKNAAMLRTRYSVMY